jgi:hypothetical protein
MTGPVGVDSDFPRYVQNMSVPPHLFQVDESNINPLSVDWSSRITSKSEVIHAL